MERSTLQKPDRLLRLPSLLMNLVASHGNRFVRDRLGQLDRRVPYAVLAALSEFGSSSQADISRRTGIDRGDLVALVAELEGEGLVTKRPDTTDRRRNSVEITAAGERHLARLDSEIEAAQRDLLEPLEPLEREQLISLLQRLLEFHDHPTDDVEGDAP